jgi:GT2 family glycosyltransferase/peptidoglycan/xylan/chitin deacetylase (PgdA/CDA1 family)
VVKRELKWLRFFVTNQSRSVAILIVNFRNPRDIRSCLFELSAAIPEPPFEIFICENGGKEAFDELKANLTGPHGPCSHDDSPSRPLPCNITTSDKLVEIDHLILRQRLSSVWVVRGAHNLGYAGAINALIARLQLWSEWQAIWILNPDTKPSPNALAELMKYSIATGKGMVGSTIVADKTSTRIACRGGLRWSKLTLGSKFVGYNDPIDAPVDIEKIEASLDTVTGAAMFVTRSCLERIGPMDERFFLYYEDLDWGMRAKPCGIGYAATSVVFHRAGTTIGSSSPRRKDRSWLSVYLVNRNRIHFVRKHYPLSLLFAVIASPRYILPYLVVGSWVDFKAALQGCLAGLKWEIGPPSRLPTTYLAQQVPPPRRHLRQKVKITISAVYYFLTVAYRAICRLFGIQPRRRLTILYYHGIRSDFLYEFRRQMETLSRSTSIVTADYQGSLPSNSVAITFDDAFVSVIENALPELIVRSFPCTIFVPVDFLGQPPRWETEDANDTFQETIMTRAQLISQTEFVTLGSHGKSHARLSRIDPNSARVEIEGSRRLLQEITGGTVRLISMPFGDFDRSTIEACRLAGYDHVYTSTPENVDPSKPKVVRGRVRVDPWDGPIEFFLKVNGAYEWLSRLRLPVGATIFSNRSPK